MLGLAKMTTLEDALFSRITESLGPHIKTRSEALRIRRILTLYLASALAVSNGRMISPMSLAIPGQDVYVKSIPSDISGIRRDYLLALQAHVKARQNYERTSRKLSQILVGVSGAFLLFSECSFGPLVL